jgi:hypothetical protein
MDKRVLGMDLTFMATVTLTFDLVTPKVIGSRSSVILKSLKTGTIGS